MIGSSVSGDGLGTASMPNAVRRPRVHAGRPRSMLAA